MQVMAHTTFQERGYCSPSGYDRIDAVLRNLCTLYNAALQERRDAYRMQGKAVTLYDQIKELTEIRRDDPDGFGVLILGAARGVLYRLDRAFNGFFRRDKPGFPRFKPWRRFECIDVVDPKPGMVKRKGRKVIVKMKGLPPIKLRPKRPLPDGPALKSLRIVRRVTGVTVDMVYEVEKHPLPSSPAAVGIDMGVRKRLTLSTGERIERATTDAEAIAEQQQRVSACKRGSNNRRKAVRQLRRMRRREAVRNRNACHRITTDIIKRFGIIAVEKLRITNMTRSAAGTAKEPGTKVAAKSGLNRSILEQTWGLLFNQLACKAEWAGRQYIEANPAFSSQDCSRCGARHNPGKSERFNCPTCGASIDRDDNAAVNILRAGINALAERQNGIRG